jgi:predicted DNA binding CopG/RHH family protein
MKQPKLADLKVDVIGTRAMRKRMAKAKKIKITINLDEDILTHIRSLAEGAGLPYQTFLNRLLRDAAEKKQDQETRLDRIEKELIKLKKQFAA